MAAGIGNPRLVKPKLVNRLQSEKRAEHRWYFAGNTTQARASCSKGPVQVFRTRTTAEHLFNQASLLQKALAVRVARVSPVTEQALAHIRQLPEPPPIVEPRYIVIVGVRSPDRPKSVVLRFDRHSNGLYQMGGFCPGLMSTVSRLVPLELGN